MVKARSWISFGRACRLTTLHRFVQWPPTGRMPEHALVPQPERCLKGNNVMARRVQSEAVTQRLGQPDPRGVNCSIGRDKATESLGLTRTIFGPAKWSGPVHEMIRSLGSAAVYPLAILSPFKLRYTCPSPPSFQSFPRVDHIAFR